MFSIGQYETWTADYGLRTTDYGLRTTDYGLRTTDYALGIKHGLRYKRRTKHYGLGVKDGLSIKHGLGYEQAHTGCKLHPLSVGMFSSFPVFQFNGLSAAYTACREMACRKMVERCRLCT